MFVPVRNHCNPKGSPGIDYEVHWQRRECKIWWLCALLHQTEDHDEWVINVDNGKACVTLWILWNCKYSAIVEQRALWPGILINWEVLCFICSHIPRQRSTEHRNLRVWKRWGEYVIKLAYFKFILWLWHNIFK